MVDYFIPILVFFGLAAILYVFILKPYFKKKKKDKEDQEVSLIKEDKEDQEVSLIKEDKEETKDIDLVEIKEFDDDEYVREVFNSVFYSIQCDNWEKEIFYDKIRFSKKKQSDRYNSKIISIEFEYRFDSNRDYKKRIFTIKDTKLMDGSYTTFYFKGEIHINVKKFLYDIYSEWVNDRNSKEKEKVDKSLENIKDVLGKASERGAKLDELLGN